MSSEIECEVIGLFDQFRDPILRYALSFGLPVHDSEEVTQEVFLSLFLHLQMRRSRSNLRGWIFRVAHNISLKQRYANQRLCGKVNYDVAMAERQADPLPNPEQRESWICLRRSVTLPWIGLQPTRSISTRRGLFSPARLDAASHADFAWFLLD